MASHKSFMQQHGLLGIAGRKGKMGNDLISRGALIQSLRGNVLVDVTPHLEDAVAGQPAAYNLGQVVQQLEERAKEAHGRFMDAACYMEFEKYSQQYREIKACLGIVKAGAIDGNALTWQGMEGKDGKRDQHRQGKANPVPDRHGTGNPAGQEPKDGHKAPSEAAA